MWTYITPELPVPDVVEAQRYYRDVLSFVIGWTAPDGSYGGVHIGTTEVFLARGDRVGRGAVCCVRVEDVEAVHAAYRESGANIVTGLQTRPWSMREFTIEDPWGHRFRIGQSTLGPPVVVGDDDEGEADDRGQSSSST